MVSDVIECARSNGSGFRTVALLLRPWKIRNERWPRQVWVQFAPGDHLWSVTVQDWVQLQIYGLQMWIEDIFLYNPGPVSKLSDDMPESPRKRAITSVTQFSICTHCPLSSAHVSQIRFRSFSLTYSDVIKCALSNESGFRAVALTSRPQFWSRTLVSGRCT